MICFGSFWKVSFCLLVPNICCCVWRYSGVLCSCDSAGTGPVLSCTGETGVEARAIPQEINTRCRTQEAPSVRFSRGMNRGLKQHQATKTWKHVRSQNDTAYYVLKNHDPILLGQVCLFSAILTSFPFETTLKIRASQHRTVHLHFLDEACFHERFDHPESFRDIQSLDVSCDWCTQWRTFCSQDFTKKSHLQWTKGRYYTKE